MSGNRDDFYADELDFLVDGRGRPIQEDPYEDDFVTTHRRFKERAAAAFEEDMAELRRKRRDMQVELNGRTSRQFKNQIRLNKKLELSIKHVVND